MQRKLQHPPRSERSGAVLVEFALVVSVFAMFLAILVELGHVYMVINTLNAAARRSARHGIAEGVTSAEVIAHANDYLDAGLDLTHVTVEVLDGAIFDDPTFNPDTYNPDTLTAVEVADLETRDIFVVRIEVPYNDVALFSPVWLKDLNLYGQSVMRHE